VITTSPPDLKQRVLAAARQLPSGVRADARSDARTIFLSTIVLSLALFLAFDGVAHSAGRRPWFLATSLVIWASVAAVSATSAWRWGASFVPGSALQLVTIAVGTPALLLAVSLALARMSQGLTSAGATARAWPCLALTFAAAVYPLAAVSVLRRGADPLHPIAGGAALGAASGAVAGVMVALWCPVAEASHVLSAHVLPIAALAVLGSLLGDRVLTLRLPRAGPPPPMNWKEAVIAKPFVSCDVNPIGGRAAGDRSRPQAVGYGEGAGGGGHHGP
jgi:hypothetical protein